MSYRVSSDVGIYEVDDGIQARVNIDHGKNTVAMDYKITLGERDNGSYGVKDFESEVDGGFIEDEYYKNNPIGGPENLQTPAEYFKDQGIDINKIHSEAEKHIQDKVNPNKYTFKEIKEDIKQSVSEFFEGMEGESPSTLRSKKFKERAINSSGNGDKTENVIIDIKNSKDLLTVFNKEFKSHKNSLLKKADKGLSM